MTCAACTSAQTNWTSGSTNPDCDQCRIRELAKAPEHIRKAAYADVEAAQGIEARLALRGQVNEEYRRLRALRGH